MKDDVWEKYLEEVQMEQEKKEKAKKQVEVRRIRKEVEGVKESHIREVDIEDLRFEK